ncbi:MAG: ester cyclase [Acidimicrobiales bacterium]
MSNKANRDLVQRIYQELHNHKNLSVADDAVAAHVRYRASGAPEVHGLAAFKESVAADLIGFPDQHITLEDIVADGDLVASRWTYRGTHRGDYFGIAPTEKSVIITFISIDRVVDGKVTDISTVWDNLEMMQQLGLVPDTAGTS